MSSLGPGSAGLLIVAGAAWGVFAGANRPKGTNSGLLALASPLLAPLLVPPAAMLAWLIGLLEEGSRPVPLGLAIAACLVVGGAMSALALANASLSALAFGGGAYLALRIVVGPGSESGLVQPPAIVAAALGVWAAMRFGAHRMAPVWITAMLGPVALAQTLAAAARIAGGSPSEPHAIGQLVGAGLGAASVAAVYVLREAARRRSRRLRRSAARAAQ